MRLISMTVRGALVAAVLAIASTGSAQGFFYQQLVRDGRIYVFNVMKEFDNFKKTGEMGKSISCHLSGVDTPAKTLARALYAQASVLPGMFCR